MSRQITIHFISGELTGRRFAVKKEGSVIGSSIGADVRCTNKDILAEHVTLLPQINADDVLLHLAQGAAVSVNGKTVTNAKDFLLHKDDDVKLGASVRFVLELEDTHVSPDAADKIHAADTDDDTADSTADTADEDVKADNGGKVTRFASEEELSDIRDYAQMRKRKRLIQFSSCVVILLLVIGGMLLYKYLSQEDILSWPGAKEKKNLDEEFRVNLGKHGKFLIFYPKNPRMIVKKDGNNCEVMSAIGRDANVPFHLVFRVNTLKNGFRTTKEKSLDDWMKVAQVRYGFVFTENPRIEFFSKRECGIPGFKVAYRRQAKNVSWSGIATYFRYEDKEIILFKEVFNQDWPRAERLLNQITCISFSTAMAMNYWEVPETLYADSLPPLNKIIRRELGKDSERSSWSEMKASISSALCLAHMAKSKDDITALEEALHLFHVQQSMWYTRRCLYFNYCKQYDKKMEMQHIRKECLDYFSDPNDYRHSKICRDNWSL